MSDEDTPTSSPQEPTPPSASVPPVDPKVDDDLETIPPAGSTPPAATAPTAPTAPVGEPVTAAAPTAQPWAVAAAPVATTTEPPRSSSHVMMPKWVVLAVAGVALAALGFGIGWVAKPDDSTSRPAASRPFTNPFNGNGPFSNGNGNNGGNGGNNDNGGSDNGNNGGTQTSGAFLGVSATTADGDTKGAAVAQVVNNGPADDAGLQSGDVITKVDSTDITTPEELVQAITAHDKGDKVTITYTRDGATKTVDVTLGDRADAPSQTPSIQPGTED